MGFKTLLHQDQIPLKLCLFIDGLDEYEGDEYEIAELFGEISRLPHVKCCLSSRPHLAFHDAFEGRPGLRLEDLTYPDIETYVTDKLQNDGRLQRLATIEPEETQKLIEEIVTYADGVFLWIKLVVASLLKGLGNRDQISDLRARLDALPRDLEQLYELMILRTDESYREEASRLFQLVATAAEERPDNWHTVRPLTILGMALAEKKDPNLVLTAKMNFLSLAEANSLCETMRDRLTSRCGGLLEVQRQLRNPSLGWTSKVLFMHRTARDFLVQPKTRALLRGRTMSGMSPAFNPVLVLLQSYILQMKAVANFKPMYCWDFISPAITFARRTDADQDPCRIRLLDELYFVSTSLASEAKSTLAQTDERSILRSKSTPQTFAVECGLHKYLAAKLEEQTEAYQASAWWASALTKLLQLALIQEAEFSKHFISAKVVVTLLEYGADPRQALSYAVRRLADCPPDEQNAQEWAKIIGVIFQAGVVPTPKEVYSLGNAFRMYPILWSEIKSEMTRQACRPTSEKETISTASTLIEKPNKERKARRKSGCRPQ